MQFAADSVSGQGPSQQYGYDPKSGQWGWGYPGAGGSFQIAGATAGTASKTPAQTIQDIIDKGTAAVPDSLKSLAQLSTNTLTSTAGVSAPVQQASDQTAQYISNLVGTGVPDYTGQRVSPLSTAEQQSLDQLKQMVNGSGAGTQAMQKAVDQKTDTSALTGAAGPTNATTLAGMDMSTYMNPALSAEYDAILHGNSVMNNATRARQAKSGAFGENSDVAQAENNESTQRQLALAGSDAFKNASANAMTDVGALNANTQANRAAAMSAANTGIQTNLTDAQRALTGGGMLNQSALATNEANSAAGATDRGVQQAGLDAQWQQYLQKLGYGLQLGQTAGQTLSSLPGQKTLSQESLGPSPAGQEIGALIGLTGLESQYSQKPGFNFSLNQGAGGTTIPGAQAA